MRIIKSEQPDGAESAVNGDEEPEGSGASEGGVMTATPGSLLATVDADALMDQLVSRLLNGRPRYTPKQIAEAADVERDVSRKLWRAMGLADVPDDEVAFTDLDLEALERTKVLLGRGDIQMHLIVQLARSLGLATARIADSIVDFTLDRLVADGSPGTSGDGSTAACGAGGGADGETSGGAAAADIEADLPLISLLLEEVDELVVYLLHRHLVDATARRLATSEGTTSTACAVGFADLVGFTALSQEMNDTDIVKLVDRFEALTSNEVVGAGGRIIKMIGDEVMFAASEETGPEIALRLAETFTDPDLPSVRVGLASGAVLSRSGDLFGPVINLAARATAIAHPGTVVIAPSIRDRLVGDDRYQLRRLRPRRLKGIGLVDLYALRRAKGHGAAKGHDAERPIEG